jgi:hypothetical protein
MKRFLMRALARAPFGNAVFRTIRYYREPVALRQFADAQSLFTYYFTNNVWGEPESASGPGSTLAYTDNIRREIPRVAAKYGVRRFLDAPCGDYNWFRSIPRQGTFDYIGGDIVEPLVRQNRERHADDHTAFVHFDIRKDSFPDADMWMCRDCLQHLSERDIVLALDNFVRSGIPYVLASTHPDCVLNTDGPTGSSRLVNLSLPPFAFGEPLLVIDDWIDGFPRRQLALWERASVAAGLASQKAAQRLLADASGDTQ